MMRYLGLLVLVGFAGSAQAQPICTKHDELAKYLDTKYGEQQTGYGTAGTTAMIEVFTSQKGTFTIVTTYPNGLACIVAAGDNWEKLEPKKKLTAM